MTFIEQYAPDSCLPLNMAKFFQCHNSTKNDFDFAQKLIV